MKKLKLPLVLLSFGCLIVCGQAAKQEKSTSNGNGQAMEQNLNFPNAVNPAKNNNQSHEKVKNNVSQKIKTDHPKKNLGNTYNKSSYSGEEKKSVSGKK
jgi:hypothetical protein